FYASDVLALGGLHVLASQGLRVPQDLAVAGYGDIAAAQFAVPSLSTVEQSVEHVGRLAMTNLLVQLGLREGCADSVQVPVRVLARASTATGPAGS
ncbi:MAG: substrate-binding domain-containing protein, partial [Leifsonia sp.]